MARRRSVCKQCGRPVQWATTDRGGYRKPFDVTPSTDGEYALFYEQARLDSEGEIVPAKWTAHWIAQGPDRDRAEVHTQHRDTCPAERKVCA